ncbi:hypothetical protein CDL12_20831 [Handroanthus impetiginosus]|uniref:Auxin response factor n=1 Tax=Handroanthus impetiginosus TaxID=429701 RepID=A0A2G9GMT0_9LAMI|nr:hypothetical protein CDL12_20831 [Handroanthus impetiginosus]
MAGPSSSAPPIPAAELDVSVWRAIAGASVQIPSLNSYVYYFPQGHLEHFSSSAFLQNSSFTLSRPMILCQVLSVRFLCNLNDQVFVRLILQPLEQRHMDNRNHDDNNQNDVVSFAKVLTPSDANNGGGFSVPRFCAELIFPELDFTAEPPVQNLILKDTFNNAWEFRHIYRGTPRRHLLTTGWSKFVNAKHLVAGDSVVFMKKRSTNELFIGVRRASRFGGYDGQDVGEAIQNAERGMPFEVVYYPRFGLPDFVVKAEMVEEALRMHWSVGMRVRMAVETDELPRKTWFQGTVAVAHGGPWFGSPWRMLQVTWDEPESLLNVNRVSPWQVEYVRPTPLLDSIVPAPKRSRLLQNPTMLPTAEHLNMGVFNNAPLSADMQGARRGHILTPGTSSANNELRTMGIERDQRTTVSTVLSVGSPYPDNLSASSSSVHFCGTDLRLSQPGYSSSTKVGSSSFQLFGKVIQTSES